MTGDSAAKGAVRYQAPITLMLGICVVVPTLFFYFSIGSSLAIGATVAAVLVLILCVSGPNQLRPVLIRAATVTAFFALAMGLHLAIAALVQPVDAIHAISSLAPMLILVAAGMSLAETLRNASDRSIDRAVRFVFWMMCSFVLAQQLGLEVPTVYRVFSNPVFPFTEPSHFVLSFMPFYLYLCVVSTPTARSFLLLLGLVLVMAMQSLTLAIGWTLAAFICTRGWILPAVVAALLAVVLTQVDLSYFLDRLDFSDATKNLSTLIYLQGWELTDESLSASRWWGLGFQQLGLNGTNTEISRVIYLLLKTDANIRDGGFGLAKILSEFGIVGIGVSLVFVTFCMRSLLRLRSAAAVPSDARTSHLFADAILAGFLIEMFVRSVGYFSPTTVLIVAAVTLLYRRVRQSATSASRPIDQYA